MSGYPRTAMDDSLALNRLIEFVRAERDLSESSFQDFESELHERGVDG